MEREYNTEINHHPNSAFPIQGWIESNSGNIDTLPTISAISETSFPRLEGAKKVAIIGAGASGCICAYHLLKKGIDVTLFDKGSPLRTLLPTGGGRCNLAHALYDFNELAKNYPRGEKFLISAFSRFSTWDTLAMFEEMGIKTYMQENGRIFPESNSAKKVRETVLNKIHNAKFIKRMVVGITKEDIYFKIITKSQSSGLQTDNDKYTHVIIAIGGHAGYEMIKELGIKIVEPKPALVGLNTKEDFKPLSGTVCRAIKADGFRDDLLFTHFGVSGPLVYKISSLRAFETFPYELEIDLAPELENLQEVLNKNPHKDIRNILKEWLPLKVVDRILQNIFMQPTAAHSCRFPLDKSNVRLDESIIASNHNTPPQPNMLTEGVLKAHQINGKTRDLILDKIHHFKVTITGTNHGEETVTAGGVDLDEINPKTMETKKIKGRYCIGEVLNIDGFCGGFNLQNAWTTAFIASENIT